MNSIRLTQLISLFALSALLHFFLTGWWAIVAWCAIGAAMAVWRAKAGALWLWIAGFELFWGAFFWAFIWNDNGHLTNLVNNSSIPAAEWIGVTIAVNLVTALLCTSVFFYGTKRIIRIGI